MDNIDDSTLTERLQQLTPDERSEMERPIQQRGDAYVLENWGTMLEQLRYIATL